MDEIQCTAIGKDGTQCTAAASPGKAVCKWHDPEWQAAQAESRRRGGLNRANRRRARKLLDSSDGMIDVQARLLMALIQVQDGEMEPAVGTAMATIARAIVMVAGVADFEERLDDLARQIAEVRSA